MPSLHQLISVGRFGEAVRKVKKAPYFQSELCNMPKGSQSQYAYTVMFILKIKKYKNAFSKHYAYDKRDKSSVYDRLILCREAVSGDTFYIVTYTRRESNDLFKCIDLSYFGGAFLLCEVLKRHSTIHDINVYKSKISLLPTEWNPVEWLMNTIPDYIQESSAIGSFLVEVNDLEVGFSEVLVGCSSRFCDGRHGQEGDCPALGSGKSKDDNERRIRYLNMVLYSEEHDFISGAEYNSMALADLLIEKETLQDKRADFEGLRECIKSQLDNYKLKDIPFLIAGWYKPDTENNSKTSHIAFMRPTEELRHGKYRDEKEIAPQAPVQPIERASEMIPTRVQPTFEVNVSRSPASDIHHLHAEDANNDKAIQDRDHLDADSVSDQRIQDGDQEGAEDANEEEIQDIATIQAAAPANSPDISDSAATTNENCGRLKRTVNNSYSKRLRIE